IETPSTFDRTQFAENQMVFSLDAFEMNRTPENQWSNNRSIKNIAQLKADLDSMEQEHNQWVYYNYINTGSTYSFFTRDRKIEVPQDVLEKKQVYDSLQNLKLQEEYQARNDSMARVAAATQQVSSESAAGDTIGQAAPVAAQVPLDTVSLDTVTGTTTGVNAEPDTIKSKIAEVLKDTLREKMLSSVSQNKAAASIEAPAAPLVLSSEQRARLDSIVNEREFQSRAASIALNTARTLKNNFSNNFT